MLNLNFGRNSTLAKDINLGVIDMSLKQWVYIEKIKGPRVKLGVFQHQEVKDKIKFFSSFFQRKLAIKKRME